MLEPVISETPLPTLTLSPVAATLCKRVDAAVFAPRRNATLLTARRTRSGTHQLAHRTLPPNRGVGVAVVARQVVDPSK